MIFAGRRASAMRPPASAMSFAVMVVPSNRARFGARNRMRLSTNDSICVCNVQCAMHNEQRVLRCAGVAGESQANLSVMCHGVLHTLECVSSSSMSALHASTTTLISRSGSSAPTEPAVEMATPVIYAAGRMSLKSMLETSCTWARRECEKERVNV